MNTKAINEVIPIYVGYDDFPYPQLNIDRALSLIAPEDRNEAIMEIERIFKYADSVDPEWEKNDLFEGSRLIAEKTCQQFPYLDYKAKKSIQWAYSFWNK
ncbi:hypothetical protein [Niveispirillum sp. BGYR6]|uniref:hypothetical protein n=1 Tax=Niveispirillum sp. BGYR6 TaxID=2971249 RepID=UPI0022B9BB85|nr:hypothetical protein [Niveispirillum sp. BGYR6]MDG5493412.1 hypothetical protein [Niveispirillum sp. BGYR6]